MAGDIRQWLEELGLGKYVRLFAEDEIGLLTLPHITEDDLKEMGVALGARRQLLAAIGEMASEPERSPAVQKPGVADAARRQVTALFADISGFTRLSNTMDAEETHAMLNDFFATVDAVVRRYGGTVDKHIGDAVMAVFGAPVAHTDDPERALRAARDIHTAAAALSPPLQVHVGVAAGQVVASTTGSAEHTEYTVTGDSVNLAARLTDLAGSGQTLASASVRRALGERFEGEAMGEQRIAGLSEPVTVWRLTGIGEDKVDLRRPFVGRRPEQERFAAAVAGCLETGAGEILVVRGEAGVGKTRLLEEFGRIASEKGFAVHTGLVLDFGTAKGQDAVRALVRSLLALAPNSGKQERSDALERAIGGGLLDEERRVYLNDLLDLEQTTVLRGLYDALGNDARNRGKREAVAALARAVSQAGPPLLKIEDLHWADAIILDHAAHLAQSSAQSRFVLLLTTRLSGDPLDETWRAMSEGAVISTIDLGPLVAKDAGELAKSFEDLSEEIVRTCVERAGGNPLFLEQLLHNADEAADGELPGSVQGIVQARLDALPADDRRALQAASVLGQRFSPAALGVMTGNDDYQPEVLLRQVLIRPAGQDYHFAHALIRGGVYASLLKPQRTALHQRAAAFFQDADPVLYAEHLDQAKNPGAAAAYLAAARLQRDGFRFDTALRLDVRALELDGGFELRCFHGDLLRDLGQTAESIAAYERALETAGDDEQICRANLGLAAGMRIGDRGKDAMACLDRTQTVATDNNFSAILAELHFLRGNLYFPLGRSAECRAEHETSLRHARESGSHEAEARALGGIGDATYAAGHMRTANEHFSNCVELCVAHGLRRIEVANRPMLAWTEFFLNKLDQAYDTGLSAVDAALATGNSRAELIARNLLSEVSYLRGDYSAVKEHGERAYEIAHRIGAKIFEVWDALTRGRGESRDGDGAAAFASFLDAYKISQATAETFMGPWILAAAAMGAGTDEDRDWSLREGERILDAGAPSHNMDALLSAGNWGEARRYAEALETYAAEEPLDWADFFIERGRALDDFGLGKRDRTAIGELKDLRDKARRVGLNFTLPPIEAALAEAGE